MDSPPSDPRAGTAIAVLAALAAAASFGVAAVLQHRQARAAARTEALRCGLLIDLARRPPWLAGIALAWPPARRGCLARRG